MTQPALQAPQFEHHPTGFGIGCASPRLSWKFDTDSTTLPGWTQSAYEIEVALDDGTTETFKHDGSSNLLVPWPHRPLRSSERAQVRVRAFGHAESRQPEATTWSPTAHLEVGLLEPVDWKASFITPAERFGPEFPLQPVRFRREFELPGDSSASPVRLYVTALGVYEASINGQVVSDECMAPGWTSYGHRLNYSVLDVTKFVMPGKPNVLAIEVGEGWYAGKLGFRGGTRFLYGGKELAAFCQLQVDGKPVVVTDESWRCMPSAIVSSELYNGEVYDMRLEQAGWNAVGGDTSSFRPVTRLDSPPQPLLVAPNAPPVRVIEERPAAAVFRSKSNKTIIDFGQNLVGRIRVKSLHLSTGHRLTVRHAEVMEHGELGTRPLNEARCEDTVIGSGEELRNWTPKFTFHGFRYVQVEGWPGGDEALQDNVVALVMHSAIRRRGFFECSNHWVNRLGWTGDINVFAPTACYLYDTIGFLDDWLSSLAVEQLADPNGIPGLVCPFVPLPDWPRIPQAVWHDVTIMLPEELFRFTSDVTVLERQFDSMRAWLDKGVDRGADGLWDLYRWQLADWLDPTAPPQQPGLSLDRLRIGKDQLAREYAQQATTLLTRFQDKYITPSGNLMSNTQTGLALAITFNLYHTPHQLTTATQQLSKLVRAARFKIATGFAGTPRILEALTQTGQAPLAYRMLLQKECPGWLFPVIAMGATTVWERWDSMLPDGSINPGSMTSFNHYALGAVAQWLHGRVGGLGMLAEGEAGWRTFRVRPVPGGNLTWAKTAFDGPCGMIRVEWWVGLEKDDDGRDARQQQLGGRETKFRMKLTVPPNSRAVVTLPSEWAAAATAAAAAAGEGEGAKEVERVVGSGVHEFACAYTAAEWPPKVLLPPNLTYSADMDEVAA
ncbi:uncharacterized protein HMPREF1541_03401 [Cyphellophora europaea CBS 101466]|uniref:alpha-L-rhamnosidase n=1 Tax=Cyphellophora europaea (strain CBS 101466) TaxID=1220924 RepID=W2RYR5_CYPE1|nr:uncharacterized protein HMPREF1541_03401 [Cyphellophora europaea CBS 101466]ETN41465.1 hypothetical protein HMPREF1541_03401 [Cyphellophora europaea CBS 101466]